MPGSVLATTDCWRRSLLCALTAQRTQKPVDLPGIKILIGGLARALQESFAAVDIPLSVENVDKVMQALDLAHGLEAPEEGDYYYMDCVLRVHLPGIIPLLRHPGVIFIGHGM